METCCSAWQVEFTYQVGDLLRTPEVQSLQSYSHHHRVSRYEHAMLVAQLAFRFARTFGWTAGLWPAAVCSMTCTRGRRAAPPVPSSFCATPGTTPRRPRKTPRP